MRCFFLYLQRFVEADPCVFQVNQKRNERPISPPLYLSIQKEELLFPGIYCLFKVMMPDISLRGAYSSRECEEIIEYEESLSVPLLRDI